MFEQFVDLDAMLSNLIPMLAGVFVWLVLYFPLSALLVGEAPQSHSEYRIQRSLAGAGIASPFFFWWLDNRLGDPLETMHWSTLAYGFGGLVLVGLAAGMIVLALWGEAD
ncbi:MAG: hypothetical protein ABEL76_02035 [Bradymonadaceae bacterium]